MILYLKNGSGIHIKKKNRGKFTSYCGGNVTSACIAKAKRSGNPTLVKRATFAANARKWKHLNGGILLKYLIGGYILPLNVLEALSNGSAARGLLEGFGRVMNKIFPTWFLKAGTYLSPLNYAAALSKGSINPKVGEEVISKWHPNLLLVARTGEAVFGGKAIKNTPKAVVNTVAKAGNKPTKAYLISKELNSTIKNGLKPTPSKTDMHPISLDDLMSNYTGGKQLLESFWLDRELSTGNPNKMIHFDNGDFKPHFYKQDIKGNSVKGAYIKDKKLVPSANNNNLWWSPELPFLQAHYRHSLSSNWGLPKRYITVDRSNHDFMELFEGTFSNPGKTGEFISKGPVDLSGASIILKNPLGWWERVKLLSNTPRKQQRIISEMTYLIPRKE